jgi:hypothetical protein
MYKIVDKHFEAKTERLAQYRQVFELPTYLENRSFTPHGARTTRLHNGTFTMFSFTYFILYEINERKHRECASVVVRLFLRTCLFRLICLIFFYYHAYLL